MSDSMSLINNQIDRLSYFLNQSNNRNFDYREDEFWSLLQLDDFLESEQLRKTVSALVNTSLYYSDILKRNNITLSELINYLDLPEEQKLLLINFEKDLALLRPVGGGERSDHVKQRKVDKKVLEYWVTGLIAVGGILGSISEINSSITDLRIQNVQYEIEVMHNDTNNRELDLLEKENKLIQDILEFEKNNSLDRIDYLPK